MNTAEGRPAWWSIGATRTALRLVPPGPARDRWTRELLAELWGLSRVEQLRHTGGLVSRVPALRAAVTSPDRVIVEDIMRKPLRCRFGWHHFDTQYSPDGTGRYLKCRRCSREEDFRRKPPLVAG